MTNMFKEKAKNYPEPKPAFMQIQENIMNIWKVIANEGYNNAYLTDISGIQRFDPVSDFKEIRYR